MKNVIKKAEIDLINKRLDQASSLSELEGIRSEINKLNNSAIKAKFQKKYSEAKTKNNELRSKIAAPPMAVPPPQPVVAAQPAVAAQPVVAPAPQQSQVNNNNLKMRQMELMLRKQQKKNNVNTESENSKKKENNKRLAENIVRQNGKNRLQRLQGLDPDLKRKIGDLIMSGQVSVQIVNNLNRGDREMVLSLLQNKLNNNEILKYKYSTNPEGFPFDNLSRVINIVSATERGVITRRIKAEIDAQKSASSVKAIMEQFSTETNIQNYGTKKIESLEAPEVDENNKMGGPSGKKPTKSVNLTQLKKKNNIQASKNE